MQKSKYLLFKMLGKLLNTIMTFFFFPRWCELLGEGICSGFAPADLIQKVLAEWCCQILWMARVILQEPGHCCHRSKVFVDSHWGHRRAKASKRCYLSCFKARISVIFSLISVAEQKAGSSTSLQSQVCFIWNRERKSSRDLFFP